MDLHSLKNDVAAASDLRKAVSRARQCVKDIQLSDSVDSEVRNRVFGIEWALIMMQNDIVALHDQWSGELCAAEAMEEKQANAQQAKCEH